MKIPIGIELLTIFERKALSQIFDWVENRLVNRNTWLKIGMLVHDV